MKRLMMIAVAMGTAGGAAWAQPQGAGAAAEAPMPSPPAAFEAPSPAPASGSPPSTSPSPSPEPPAATSVPGGAASSAPPAPEQPAPPSPAAQAPAAAPKPSAATLAAINNATLSDTGVKDGVDPAILRAEVMLDRVHDSPGVIDGRDGENFEHALEMFEEERGLPPSKRLDERNWGALLKESGGPVLAEHTLTAAEVAGPFFPDIPRDYAKQAQMKTLGYRSVAQKLGGEFHMGEALLAELNPGVDLGKAGTTILVAVTTPEPFRHPLHEIIVDKGKSQVLGLDREGQVVIAVPATIGSKELPSPSGTYKVKGVAWHPIYYYNPKNFVQGDNKEKLQLPPGPNNPVGNVFIALTKPTYGLHGTPDPSKIDKTASHGCVRMTNWDAMALAHLVHPGLVVSFRKHFEERHGGEQGRRHGDARRHRAKAGHR